MCIYSGEKPITINLISNINSFSVYNKVCAVHANNRKKNYFWTPTYLQVVDMFPNFAHYVLHCKFFKVTSRTRKPSRLPPLNKCTKITRRIVQISTKDWLGQICIVWELAFKRSRDANALYNKIVETEKNPINEVSKVSLFSRNSMNISS